MYPNEVNFHFWVHAVCTQMIFFDNRRNHMKDLKRMLEAIHKENKDILTLLLSIDKNETKDLDEIMIDVDSMYDEKFYGNTKSDRE
jgi:hypothetical protein